MIVGPTTVKCLFQDVEQQEEEDRVTCPLPHHCTAVVSIVKMVVVVVVVVVEYKRVQEDRVR